MLELLIALEQLDDVQNIFTNIKIYLQKVIESDNLSLFVLKKKNTIFRSTISDLSGKFSRIKLKYFSEFFVSSSLKSGYKLEKMTLNVFDILLSIYIFYR